MPIIAYFLLVYYWYVDSRQPKKGYMARSATVKHHGGGYARRVNPWVKAGQSGACSSRLRRVRGRVQPLWVYCTQSFPTFLQEAVSRTWTRDLMVTRQQLYHCAKAPLHVCSCMQRTIQLIVRRINMIKHWLLINFLETPNVNLTKFRIRQAICSDYSWYLQTQCSWIC